MVKILNYIVCVTIVSFGFSMNQKNNFLSGNHDTANDSIPEIQSSSQSKEIKFFGDHTIEAHETYSNNIRIIGGNLTVKGTLKSRATIIGGDVHLLDYAVIDGEIIVVGGEVHRSENAIVNGKIIETNLKEGLVYRETSGDSNERDTELGDDRNDSHDGDWKHEFTIGDHYPQNHWIHPEANIIIYNRNEGFILTPITTHWDQDGLSSFRLSLSVGYRFGNDKLWHDITFEKSFFTQKYVTIFGSIFTKSKTDDYYRISENENTAAGIFGRQDFYDRWEETGWRAGLGLNLLGIHLSTSIYAVDQDSIPIYTDLWSFTNKNRKLRQNHIILPGEKNYLQLKLEYETSHYHPLRSSIKLAIHSEWIQKENNINEILAINSTDFSNRLYSMLVVNWEFTPGIVLRGQGILGTSTDLSESMRYFGVGGLGSVSAHPYKQKTGDQMVQGNLELVFAPEFIDSDWALKIFWDTGAAWMQSNYNLNEIFNHQEQFISAVGIGVMDVDHDDIDIGINIAKSLNGDNHYETTFRLGVNF